jgi:hypothetical protein
LLLLVLFQITVAVSVVVVVRVAVERAAVLAMMAVEGRLRNRVLILTETVVGSIGRMPIIGVRIRRRFLIGARTRSRAS